MLQEVIRTTIEDLLNANTKSVQFVVGQYAKKDDRSGDFVYNVKLGYKYLAKTYIPAMMVFNCSYTAIPYTRTGYATITLDFLLPTNNDTVDSDFNDKLTALDEFVPKIVGMPKTITDGSTVYNNQWSMSAFTNPKPLEPMNGIYYVAISTTIFIDFSDTFYYSNQWLWYLNRVRIYPVLAKRSRVAEQENPHILGTAEAVTENASNAWSCMQTFYVNSTLSAMLDVLNGSNYTQETVYELGVSSPTTTSGDAVTVSPIPDAVFTKVSAGTTMTLFSIPMSFIVTTLKKVKSITSVTGTYSALLKTYTALLASDTAGIAYDYTTDKVYLKISTNTASSTALLEVYLHTNPIGLVMALDGIYKSVIIKEHTDPQALGEKAEVTLTFVLSNTAYAG
jgi:hypothetical protein